MTQPRLGRRPGCFALTAPWSCWSTYAARKRFIRFAQRLLEPMFLRLEGDHLLREPEKRVAEAGVWQSSSSVQTRYRASPSGAQGGLIGPDWTG
jgi:hypothetical protein